MLCLSCTLIQVRCPGSVRSPSIDNICDLCDAKIDVGLPDAIGLALFSVVGIQESDILHPILDETPWGGDGSACAKWRELAMSLVALGAAMSLNINGASWSRWLATDGTVCAALRMGDRTLGGATSQGNWYAGAHPNVQTGDIASRPAEYTSARLLVEAMTAAVASLKTRNLPPFGVGSSEPILPKNGVSCAGDWIPVSEAISGAWCKVKSEQPSAGDRTTFHVSCAGDSSAGLNDQDAEVVLFLDPFDSDNIAQAKSALADAFAQIWGEPARRVRVVTDAELRARSDADPESAS